MTIASIEIPGRTPEDFILELEFQADSTMNFGIQFRSESRADYKDGRVHGYQMEIDPSDRRWSGGIYDEGRRLWLYSLEYNPAAGFAYRRAGWNHNRIEAIGKEVRTFVNGVPAAHQFDLLGSLSMLLEIGAEESQGLAVPARCDV